MLITEELKQNDSITDITNKFKQNRTSLYLK